MPLLLSEHFLVSVHVFILTDPFHFIHMLDVQLLEETAEVGVWTVGVKQ